MRGDACIAFGMCCMVPSWVRIVRAISQQGHLDACSLAGGWSLRNIVEDAALSHAAQGAVLVTLKKAAALPAADSNGLADPYVKMNLDEQKRHSTTVRRSRTPSWNEKFEWLQARAHPAPLTLETNCCGAPLTPV